MIYALIEEAGLLPSPMGWPKVTDLPEYVRRQGQACLYMYDILDRLRKAEPRLAGVLDDLRQVHQEQETAIRQYTSFPSISRSSFYFDSLYHKVLGIKGIENLPDAPAQRVSLFLIHVVGYLRGWDRYNLLRAYEPSDLWVRLFPQAWSNASLLAEAMADLYGAVPLLTAWPEVAIRESHLMRRIWKHKGLSSR